MGQRTGRPRKDRDSGSLWISYLGNISQVAQTIKNLPAKCETWVRSLGQEDPLEKRMASIRVWRIRQTEDPDEPQSMGCKESDTTERLTH